jgi:hypothetical protein
MTNSFKTASPWQSKASTNPKSTHLNAKHEIWNQLSNPIQASEKELGLALKFKEREMRSQRWFIMIKIKDDFVLAPGLVRERFNANGPNACHQNLWSKDFT